MIESPQEESAHRDAAISAIEKAYQDACQRPSDINEHLPTLRKYAEKCARVTEFGVRGALSTVALLAALPERLHCYDINDSEAIGTIERWSKEVGVEFRFHKEDVLGVEIEPTDLLFIDTYHSYDQLSRELRAHAPKVGRYIILHDTVTFGFRGEGQSGAGLLLAMHEFLHGERGWFLREMVENNNGLAVIERSRTSGSEPLGLSDRDIIPEVCQPNGVKSYRSLLTAREQRISSSRRIGLTIGTFASTPYVHLQLESRRRFCPEIPCFVHDDGSPDAPRINELCDEYGAEFYSPKTRSGHAVGDMRVFLAGLQWAKSRQVDFLVKFSRRWVPLAAWHQEMLGLLEMSDAPTLSGRCLFHGFGFRSECVGMQVAAWLEGGVTQPIVDEVKRGHCPLVEAVIHRAAQNAFHARSGKCKEYEVDHPHHPGCGGYIDWGWLGDSRTAPRADILWHEWARAHEYRRALLQWGIDRYAAEDFIDPSANLKG